MRASGRRIFRIRESRRGLGEPSVKIYSRLRLVEDQERAQWVLEWLSPERGAALSVAKPFGGAWGCWR